MVELFLALLFGSIMGIIFIILAAVICYMEDKPIIKECDEHDVTRY